MGGTGGGIGMVWDGLGDFDFFLEREGRSMGGVYGCGEFGTGDVTDVFVDVAETRHRRDKGGFWAVEGEDRRGGGEGGGDVGGFCSFFIFLLSYVFCIMFHVMIRGVMGL